MEDSFVITPENLNEAIDKIEFITLASISRQAGLSATEKDAITDMIKAIAECHRKMTNYSAGEDNWGRLVAQSIQSVLFSMLDTITAGPAMLTNLANTAYATTQKNDFGSALEKIMKDGIIELTGGVEGNEKITCVHQRH